MPRLFTDHQEDFSRGMDDSRAANRYPGNAAKLIQNGRIEIGGEIPCNTSGGMLSESYMQSWNHQPELVRQLRRQYEGTERQVAGAEVGQYVHDVAGKCLSVVYTRGN